jgi:hypothetical protein
MMSIWCRSRLIFNRLKKWLDDLPVKQKLIVLTTVAFCNVAWVFGLSIFALDSLSGIRASVAAQNSWIKSVNQTVFILRDYIKFDNEEDYQRYLKVREIPLSYGIANREVYRPKLR